LLFFPTAAATAKAYTGDPRRWRGVRVRRNDGKKPRMALELEDICRYDAVRKSDRFVPVGENI